MHDDDKLEIVMSVGASVTQVAQRHGARRQQIYAWRHELKKKGLRSPNAGALFYPLDIPVTTGGPVVQQPVLETAQATAVELRMKKSRYSGTQIVAVLLDASVLGPDAQMGTPEFDLYVKEVQREMVHPFTHRLHDVELGDTVLSKSRVITLEDIETFAHFTSDTFYAHMNEEAAKANPFSLVVLPMVTF